jgi:hypothetical protein
MIYIGHFDIFDDRSINSLYADGAIYITNNQDDELDMVDDIMHEAAHAIEAPYGYQLYMNLGIRIRIFTEKNEIVSTFENSRHQNIKR